MLPDNSLILCEIDAEGFVISYVALDPLDIRTELVQHFIRLGGSAPKLLPLKSAYFGDSLSMTNLRSAIMSSYGCPCT